MLHADDRDGEYILAGWCHSPICARTAKATTPQTSPNKLFRLTRAVCAVLNDTSVHSLLFADAQDPSSH